MRHSVTKIVARFARVSPPRTRGFITAGSFYQSWQYIHGVQLYNPYMIKAPREEALNIWCHRVKDPAYLVPRVRRGIIIASTLLPQYVSPHAIRGETWLLRNGRSSGAPCNQEKHHLFCQGSLLYYHTFGSPPVGNQRTTILH